MHGCTALCLQSEWCAAHSSLLNSRSEVAFPFQRETRSHYGCPTSNGLELEFEGGAGSRFSHWEKRLVEVIAIMVNKHPSHLILYAINVSRRT